MWNKLLILILLCSSISFAQNRDREITPVIDVNRLSVFKNQNLTALFVEAEPTAISFDKTGLKVVRVASRFNADITGDSVIIPSQDMPREFMKTGYNYLLIIISPTKDFSWVNHNGTRPQGDTVTFNNQVHFVKVISRSQLLGSGNISLPIF